MKSLDEFFERSIYTLFKCTVGSGQKWDKILFYLTVFVEDIRLTDISTRSEYVVDIWVLMNNRQMSISRKTI